MASNGFQIPGLTTLFSPTNASNSEAGDATSHAVTATSTTNTSATHNAVSEPMLSDNHDVSMTSGTQRHRSTPQDISSAADEVHESTAKPEHQQERMEIDQTEETQPTGDISSVAPPTDEPPTPPSLTAGLEAMLGGLDPVQPGVGTLPDRPDELNHQGGQVEPTGGDDIRGPDDAEPEHPEWEADSSPYESSSDSSSSDDSDEDSEDEGDYKVLGPEETARILMQMDGGSDDEGDGKAKGNGASSQLRTKNELPEEIIPKPNVELTPETPIELLGTIEHIVESTAVIQANTTGEYRVLDTGSVLCTQDRTVIAAIADLIGSVRQPRYTARLSNEEEIKGLGLELGSSIYYPPEHAKYVFTAALQGTKGTDASNWHDEEAGEEEIEFSDDEREAEYKRRQKMKRKEGRGGRGGGVTNDRGGKSGGPPQSGPSSLNYDDDDEDGPYKPLARPANFGQGPPPPIESSYGNGYPNQGASHRGGRGDFRGRSRGRGQHQRGGHGHGSRGSAQGGGGYSRPSRNAYSHGHEGEAQPHAASPSQPPTPSGPATFNAPSGYPTPQQMLALINSHTAAPNQQFATFQGSQPSPQQNFPFPFPPPPPPQFGQQNFVPPPPPQFTAGSAGVAGAYYNPAFFPGLQQQGQPGQQGQQSQHGQQGQQGQWARPDQPR